MLASVFFGLDGDGANALVPYPQASLWLALAGCGACLPCLRPARRETAS